MPRFIYTAGGVAVSGRITRPISRELDPQGVCILPPTGGSVSSRTGAFSLTDPASGEFLFSYGSAETSIQGSETSTGTHTTVVTSTVRDLNVGNVLKVAEITARLSLSYEEAGDRITVSTEGSQFVDLTIGGDPFVIDVDHAMASAASDYDAFKKQHGEFREKLGKITWVLGRNKDLQPDEDGEPHRRHPNFGRIYFCEWQAGPGTQKLTMMRLKLGSPQAGDLNICNGSSNGQTYP